MISPAFQMLVHAQGDDLIVFKNHGTPQESKLELRGIKNSDESGNVIFNLPLIREIARGDIIQVKNARDLWRITETEDEPEEGTLLVHVDKEGTVSRRPISAAPVIINNQNSPGANFHLGHGSIQQHASWVELAKEKIDGTVTSTEEKQKAKSLLTQISENKLLNTIIGSAVGELTKAALSK